MKTKYDLIVTGGGISGVAAAVSAAREGLSVLLIERSGTLGGAMAQNLVFPFMKFSLWNDGKDLLSDGIFTEMRKRMEAMGDASWECYKFVFDDMVEEAGVTVLFHAAVFEAERDGRKVRSVSAATKSGVLRLEADSFIDCTGDGDLMATLGCDYQLGRETDSLCQPMTTCFRVGNVDIDRFLQDRPMLEAKYRELREAGEIQNPRENILVFWGLGEGIVHFNTTRVIRHNPVDAFELSEAEMIARRQVREMLDFLRKYSAAFQKCNLISLANQIGVRESRKLKGRHILTAEELVRNENFADTIALGNYDIDIHNPEGTGTHIHRFTNGTFYRIPYRSLLPKEYDNFLVAGRCISATHEAQAAIRIMPICACLGQAAGTAAALAKRQGCGAPEVDISALQALLKERHASIR